MCATNVTQVVGRNMTHHCQSPLPPTSRIAGRFFEAVSLEAISLETIDPLEESGLTRLIILDLVPQKSIFGAPGSHTGRRTCTKVDQTISRGRLLTMQSRFRCVPITGNFNSDRQDGDA